MSFVPILKELTQKARATGAVMLAPDGEIVEACAEAQALEMDLIGAHHGIILDIIKEASTRSAIAGVRYVSITTTNARLVIMPLKEGYYLVVTMGRANSLGRALFASERAARRIEEEMG